MENNCAGYPATIIDSDTGKIIIAYLFIGIMTYNQYTYVEAFISEKQKTWITTHIHMFEFFRGVFKIPSS